MSVRDLFADLPRRIMPPRQMKMHLTMDADPFGATGMRFPMAGPLVEVPFTLGPITGRAVLAGPVNLSGSFGYGDQVDFPIVFLPDGDPTPADLLEAFGAQITR